MGDFVWTGGDCHLYSNHLDQAREQLTRAPGPIPRLEILRKPASISAYEYEDFVIHDYVAQPHIKAGFLCGLALAIVVCAVNIRRLSDRQYRFAALILLTGILQWLFISEEGPSAAYGNFSWGRDYGDYFILLVSVALALGNWYSRDRLFGGRKTPQVIYFIIVGGLFLLHLLSGLCYFYLVLTGHGYYI